SILPVAMSRPNREDPRIPIDDRTTVIQRWIDRLRAGDDRARDELLRTASDRLSRLARRMLEGYPRVARWEPTSHVVQSALLRLDRALRAVTPPTARDFFRLASAQIRRELIDLERRYYGPEGLGSHYTSWGGSKGRAAADLGPADTTNDPAGLVEWT